MPNLRMIRRRISAVETIQQVTRAMQMIAASRVRRAQESILQARPYADRLDLLIRHMASQVEQDAHPLLAVREHRHATLVAITGDRGLCRGFNANVLRQTMERRAAFEAEGASVEVVAVGRRAVEYFARNDVPMALSLPGVFQHIEFQTAVTIAEYTAEQFRAGATDLVEVIYNEFLSMIRQDLVTRQFLPLAPVPVDEDELFVDYIYEPDRQAIWSSLIDKYLNFTVWRMLLESNAAEQAARMTAMEEATNNAEDMIKNLVSVRNKVRQTSITTELGEIVGAAEALK